MDGGGDGGGGGGYRCDCNGTEAVCFLLLSPWALSTFLHTFFLPHVAGLMRYGRPCTGLRWALGWRRRKPRDVAGSDVTCKADIVCTKCNFLVLY